MVGDIIALYEALLARPVKPVEVEKPYSEAVVSGYDPDEYDSGTCSMVSCCGLEGLATCPIRALGTGNSTKRWIKPKALEE